MTDPKCYFCLTPPDIPDTVIVIVNKVDVIMCQNCFGKYQRLLDKTIVRHCDICHTSMRTLSTRNGRLLCCDCAVLEDDEK